MYLYVLYERGKYLGQIESKKSLSWIDVTCDIWRKGTSKSVVDVPAPSAQSMADNGWRLVRELETAWGTLYAYQKIKLSLPKQLNLL